MCCSNLETFGVPEVIKAADTMSCRCGGEGCALPIRAEDVVRWQAEAEPEAKAGSNEPTD